MTILFASIFTILLAPGNRIITLVVQEPEPYQLLWNAVKMVESYNRNDAVNYDEAAYGIAQIRQCKLDEYYRYTGIRYSLHDCLREDVSYEIFNWHCNKWRDIETAAKRWNGSGPLTTIYWNKIKRYL